VEQYPGEFGKSWKNNGKAGPASKGYGSPRKNVVHTGPVLGSPEQDAQDLLAVRENGCLELQHAPDVEQVAVCEDRLFVLGQPSVSQPGAVGAEVLDGHPSALNGYAAVLPADHAILLFVDLLRVEYGANVVHLRASPERKDRA